MRFATKLFLVVFWFVMGMFFFVMFSIHGIKGEMPPVTAFLGMTCFGLGFLYIACYCTERIARDIYRKLKKDKQAFIETCKSKENSRISDLPEDVIAFYETFGKSEEETEQEPTLFSEEELNKL